MEKDIETFIIENMRLVYKCTNKYRDRYDYEDILQEATIALIEAYEVYDKSTGYAFSTIAYPYIRGRVMNYVRDYGNLVKLPAYVQAIQAQIEKNNWFDLEDAEIAKALNVRVSFVKTAKKEMGKSWTSLEYKIPDERKLSVLETMGADDDFSKVIVDDFFRRLNPTEREILEKKLVGYKPIEIAFQRNVTKQRISNTMGNVKEKARAYFMA